MRIKLSFRLTLEQLRRILTRIHQSLNLVDYTLTVFGISHTEPLAGCIEHFAGSSAIVNQLIHHQRDEEFAFQILHILRVTQEALEKLCTVSKVIGSKAPEVHADRSRLRRCNPGAELGTASTGFSLHDGFGQLVQLRIAKVKRGQRFQRFSTLSFMPVIWMSSEKQLT